ncbi:MAG: hypothetical protein NZ811_01145, partial [Gammaproteobacteria bacterium]|nr:hypothetical protein [Gammaproteobacteria bacterium]
GYVDDLTDASTANVAANDILVYNGSSFVVESMTDLIANPTLFTFSTTSFDDGISGTQLIGDGDWKAIDAITYTAVYVAGPPDTSADIEFYDSSNPSADWQSLNSMDVTGDPTTSLTSGNNDTAIAYPSAAEKYIKFRLEVVNDGNTTTKSAGNLYFRNNIYYGANASASLNQTEIKALNTTLAISSNSYDDNRSINASGNKYLYIAVPAGYDDFHINSAANTFGFKFQNITIPFSKLTNVDVTNTATYEEAYDVYRSNHQVNTSSTLNLSTSDTSVNHIFCGVSVSADPDRVDVGTNGFDSVNQTTASNDITRTWSSVTAGSGEYIMFAWPANSRIDSTSGTTSQTPTFTVGVLSGGFRESDNSPADYTNANGYTESYRIFVSNNANLGAATVITS